VRAGKELNDTSAGRSSLRCWDIVRMGTGRRAGQQLHIGALRNNNSRMDRRKLGCAAPPSRGAVTSGHVTAANIAVPHRC